MNKVETEALLKRKVKQLTRRIGDAVKEDDGTRADALRKRRFGYMTALAYGHECYSLINAEGQTEFVDRHEWEQRMVAWARRTGVIPRAGVHLPDAPPAGDKEGKKDTA